MIRTSTKFGIFAGAIAALLVCAPSFAQAVDPAKEYAGIIDTFQGTGATISNALMGFAKSLFGMLFTVQLLWQLGQLVLRENGGWGDIGEFFVKQVMYFGFFYALLLNSYSWGDAIISSFRMAGAKAVTSIGGVGTFAPIDVFVSGFQMAGSLLAEMSMWPSNYAANLVILLCALALVIMCAYISILITMAIIESHVVVGAATLLMGFGGGSWTKEVAISTLRFMFSIGAKIFMMHIIVGMAFAPLKSWAARIGGIDVLSNMYALFVIVGLVFFVVLLVQKLPDMIQALISGTASPTTGAASLSGAAAALTGAAMAIGAAGKLAGAQAAASAGGAGSAGAGPAMKSLGGQSSTGGAMAMGQQAMGMLGHGASLAGNLGSNLVKAGLKDLGGKLTGQKNFGTIGGRMAQDMNLQAAALKSKPEMPEAPDAQKRGGGSGAASAAPGGSIRPASQSASGASAGATSDSSSGPSVGRAPATGNSAGQGTPAPVPGPAETSLAEANKAAAGSPAAAMDPDASAGSIGPSETALAGGGERDAQQDDRDSSQQSSPSLGGILSGAQFQPAAEPQSPDIGSVPFDFMPSDDTEPKGSPLGNALHNAHTMTDMDQQLSDHAQANRSAYQSAVRQDFLASRIEHQSPPLPDAQDPPKDS